MRSTSHILVVNGTKVRRPVFLLGAPHSGTDLLARALKRSPEFHLTLGRPEVVRTAYAFARRPDVAAEQGVGAARVMRDAFAQSWQITPGCCRECPNLCRDLTAIRPDGTCSDVRSVQRFADATPDLLYSTGVLLAAFPDAQFVQAIRDGRDAVAGMLDDERCLAWFKPGIANLDEVFPNPFFGVEDATERMRWPRAGLAVKCALRWRGSIRLSARLRARLPDDQLFTVRYEDLIAHPREVVADVSAFVGVPLSAVPLAGVDERDAGGWRQRLTDKQVTQVEKIAGDELRRLGYELTVEQ